MVAKPAETHAAERGDGDRPVRDGCGAEKPRKRGRKRLFNQARRVSVTLAKPVAWLLNAIGGGRYGVAPRILRGAVSEFVSAGGAAGGDGRMARFQIEQELLDELLALRAESSPGARARSRAIEAALLAWIAARVQQGPAEKN